MLNMKISCVKYIKDNNSFRWFKNIGIDVYNIEDMDEIDNKLNELVDDNYSTIFISSDLAAHSGDIVKKYRKDDNIRIIIS